MPNVGVYSINIESIAKALMYEPAVDDNYFAFRSNQSPKQSHFSNVIYFWAIVKNLFIQSQPLKCPLCDLSIAVPPPQILASSAPWLVLLQFAALDKDPVI